MKVLVIGRAWGVWEEVAELQAMTKFDATILIGMAGVDYPGQVDHWATFHTNLFPQWIEQRRANGYPDALNFWGTTFKERVQIAHPRIRRVQINGGSSGMIGVVVALEKLRATHVALAGTPLDPERGHYDNATKLWEDGLNYRQAWLDRVDSLRGRVRSMSGWTRELLGGEPPTAEWFSKSSGS